MAVEDGRIVGIGVSRRLGRYLVLRDTYGDLFTYAGLGSIAPRYRLPKPTQVKGPDRRLPSGEAANDPTPKQAASAGRQLPVTLARGQEEADCQEGQAQAVQFCPERRGRRSGGGAGKVRVFAHPDNPDAIVAIHIRERPLSAKTPKAGRS